MKEGRWYWVSEDGIEWSPAMRDKNSVGGWTNCDTWEDFTHDIKYWQLIPSPKKMIIPNKKSKEPVLTSPLRNYGNIENMPECDQCKTNTQVECIGPDSFGFEFHCRQCQQYWAQSL